MVAAGPAPSYLGPRRPRFSRSWLEAAAFASRSPGLSLSRLTTDAPRGDGHAVLVLPAWFRADAYTSEVRQCLTELGYDAQGWQLGINVGPTRRLLEGSAAALAKLADQRGPVSILGFSMGGLFARWLASQTPQHVRQIITVCSSIRDPMRNFWLPLAPLSGLWPGVDLAELAEQIERKLAVPVTCLFSRDDGLVNYAACLDEAAPQDSNIDIGGPHVLIASNPTMMTIVAQRLGRPPLAMVH